MTMRRSDAVQAGLILGCGTGMALAGHALHRRPEGLMHLGVEAMLGMGLAVLGLGIVAVWLLALILAFTTEVLARRGRARAAHVLGRFTPALMRRLAVAFLGINLLASPAMAHAAPSVSSSAGSAAEGIPAVVEVLSGSAHLRSGSADSPYWSPSRAEVVDAVKEQEPPVSPAWRPAPLPVDGGLLLRQETRPERQAAEIVVVRGDSLWSIVGERLGPLATDADIAAAWPAWFEVNREIIGDDPSRLVPGQVLVAPSD